MPPKTRICQAIDEDTGVQCTGKNRYGLPGTWEMTHCKKHATSKMKMLDYPKCKECNGERATRAENEDEPVKYCLDCATKLGIETINKTVGHCKHVADGKKCKKIATCGPAGGKRLSCPEHSEDDYINLNTKDCILCKDKGEKKTATFAKTNSTTPEYCADCVKENGIDAYPKSRWYCKVKGCEKTRHYGLPGKPAEYCSDHKTEKMVHSGVCEYGDCGTIAKFNTPGEKTGKFCNAHAEDGMVHVYKVVCSDGCGKIALYNYPTQKMPVACCLHKLPGMIDVNVGRCKICKNARANYGRPGTPATHCCTCKTVGMIVHPNTKCKTVGCNKQAYWGKEFVLTHCEDHKSDDAENYVEKPCLSCGLEYVLNAEGKCEACDPESFQKYALAKQRAIVKFLIANGYEPTSIDKSVDYAICGRERPDIVFEREDRVLIIECDEHQHKGRDCTCEQTRMINVSQSYGGLPVIFIRFNPDKYRSNGNVGMAKRYELLADIIDDFEKDTLDYPRTALCSALYLFFDDWTELASETWVSLLEYEPEEPLEPIIIKKRKKKPAADTSVTPAVTIIKRRKPKIDVVVV